MDKERCLKLAKSAQYPTSIIGNPSSRHFMLLALTRVDPPEAAWEEAAEHGMVYCGVIGMRQGEPHVVLEEPLAADSVAELTRVFRESVAAFEAARDSWTEFAESLWSLKDTRE